MGEAGYEEEEEPVGPSLAPLAHGDAVAQSPEADGGGDLVDEGARGLGLGGGWRTIREFCRKNGEAEKGSSDRPAANKETFVFPSVFVLPKKFM